MNSPLISIITPSYNQGQFIRRTIDSVLTQDYSNIEYWVIDGGSTDDTVAILKEYDHDPRFHWISEPDKGQSDAINKGLAKVSGEIFAWLNSDDVYSSEALNKVAEYWMTAQKPVILYGLCRFIDENDNDLGPTPGQSRSMNLDKILQFGRFFLPQPSVFCPLHTVREIGGVDINLHYTMDLALWIRLANNLPIVHIPHELAHYRLHSTSKTCALSTKFIEDTKKVFISVAEQGILNKNRALARSDLFAATVYLTPEAKNFRLALSHISSALNNDFSVFSEVFLIVAKAFARSCFGDKLWRELRFLRSRY